ncbi:hypothetical protein NDU88_002758 [Pleurodeles waltl]|uniref:RNase H type-1 domain-containing protein n=1 Tax=Pleurodeles waltl TaxID=8319 RepID=A0AAV7W0K9_PLEWA|nr:hypothetical protein NDU88_002758 [Pleurodeles waltl]
MDTPLDHMMKMFPSDKKRILKYCKQWHKGTEDHAQPWPKEETFDHDIAEHILTDIRSTYKKKKRQKREAILSLWRVFCHEKEKDKSTAPEEAVAQTQEVAQTQTESSGDSLGEPPPYGLYPILPAAGYQDPVRVEPKEERLEAQEAELTPAPVPSAPRADPEQSGRDRLVSELQHTVRQAEQYRSLAPLRGQWTTGHVILRLGDTSAETLREAAEEWIEEEEEWEGGVDMPPYEEPPDGSQVATGAEDDEEWDNGFNRGAHEQGVNRRLYNFRPRPPRELVMTARDVSTSMGHKPIAYYSGLLDAIMKGHYPCEQALAAAAFAVQKSATIMMGSPLTLYVEHVVFAILQRSKSTLTTQSVSGNEVILSIPSLQVVMCHTVNPATFFAHPVSEDEQVHDCATYTPEKGSEIGEDPILGSMLLFVDGSSFIDQKTGIRHSGAAVVKAEQQGSSDTLQIVSQIPLPSHFSAQAAELVAMIEALQHAEGLEVTIYSDSAYVTTTVHSSIRRWERRGFLKSDGSPVMHKDLLAQLIKALTLPSKVAIIKCAAHTNQQNLVSRGNALADWAAKEAAKTSPNLSEQDEHTLGMMTNRQQSATELPPPYTETARLHLHKLQEQALPHERELWEHRGCIQSPTDFIYRQESTGRPVARQEKCTTAAQQTSPISVGQQVYIRNFVRRWKDSKFEGPYLVTQSTPTVVKVEGRKPWIHLSDVRLSPASCHTSPSSQEHLEEGKGKDKDRDEGQRPS